jgi:hypothetical protein
MAYGGEGEGNGGVSVNQRDGHPKAMLWPTMTGSLRPGVAASRRSQGSAPAGAAAVGRPAKRAGQAEC